MEQLDKDQLPQNWKAPLIKFVSNYIWQVCERVDMTDLANHPNGDGSGKSPAYGAYAGPVEQLLNNAFEGALKNWEIGPFAAWIGKTKIFNDLDFQWDFAISLPDQHLTRPISTTAAATAKRPMKRQFGTNGDASPFDCAQQQATVAVEEDVPVADQWSLIVWLKPGERGTTVDLRRFTMVVDKMANPAFIKSADGSWDIFLSHFQGNAGNTVMSLKALLESASPGLRCWLDKDEDATEAGMRRGVAGSRYYLLFLTQGVLARPFVQLEAREALALGKPVILLHETDPRFGAAPGFNDYVAEAPPDLKQIFSLANSIPWYREEEFRAQQVSAAWTRPLVSGNGLLSGSAAIRLACCRVIVLAAVTAVAFTFYPAGAVVFTNYLLTPSRAVSIKKILQAAGRTAI